MTGNPWRRAIEIPEALKRIAETTLARVPEADAIVLFGSRARGDADDRSDWDIMVRSRRKLPQGVMEREGIIPHNGRVPGLGTVQETNLSDYEALHHCGVDDSMAVPWSREGIVIAGTDRLIGGARRENLRLKEAKVEYLNEKVLEHISEAWESIVGVHRKKARPYEMPDVERDVITACEWVAQFAMYAHGVAGAKGWKMHKLPARLRAENPNSKDAERDAAAIEAMREEGDGRRRPMLLADMPLWSTEQRDAEWPRTALRWGTMLPVHTRTLRRLQDQGGAVADAAREASRKSEEAATIMLKRVRDPDVERTVPKEAPEALRAWARNVASPN